MLLSRADIYAQLARINVVGTELALYYPRHLEVPIICSEPYKFETKSPEGGGCNLITLGARLISIKAREFVLRDEFRLLNSNAKIDETILIVQLNQLTISFLEDCQDLIIQAKGGSLSRIVITATLTFAKISELVGWYHRTHPVPGKDETRLERRKSTGLESRDNRRNTAREFLADAFHLCD
ncbi:unnamed protein product [Penicillium nalgiovense]|nr:unnamed protein product [Penicillium nalgiovense]